ncbi:MAG: hypothetical protein IJG45_00955 [Oscillospiraceae bacterium]|nr:hypothetical protein [Oscillospiraceae bacterium]
MSDITFAVLTKKQQPGHKKPGSRLLQGITPPKLYAGSGILSIAIGNEQLAVEIKAGNSALLLPLWEQVKPYIRKQAQRWIFAFDGLHGVEPDDLIHAGYFACCKPLIRSTQKEPRRRSSVCCRII